jgi:hypothetical protein
MIQMRQNLLMMLIEHFPLILSKAATTPQEYRNFKRARTPQDRSLEKDDLA